MCFHSKLSKSAQELRNRFCIKMDDSFSPGIYNGFQYPATPVITNKAQDKIQLFNWGLIPHNAVDVNIRSYTLNARVETIDQKPSFKNVVKNRCLVIVDGFYEWQWLDAKGKRKQKYLISMPNDEIFTFAGLWSEWTDQSTGEIIRTYTILTTEANELLSVIHNSKKRMPFILAEEQEKDWLNGLAIHQIDVPLKAEKV